MVSACRNCVPPASTNRRQRVVDRPDREPAREGRALLQRPDRGPERALHALALLVGEGVEGEGVADMAAVLLEVADVRLGEHPLARGADERRRGPEALPLELLDPARGSRGLLFRNPLRREPHQQPGQLQGMDHVIDVDAPEDARRHLSSGGGGGVLDHRDPAARLHRHHPRRAAVLEAGEDHADHARPVGPGGGPEERVDRGTVAVLARPAHDLDVAGPHEEVAVGRREVDAPGSDGVPVERMHRLERAAGGEELRHLARVAGRGVDHHEERRGKPGGQLRDELEEQLDAAGRRAEHDDVAVGHAPTVGSQGAARLPPVSVHRALSRPFAAGGPSW